MKAKAIIATVLAAGAALAPVATADAPTVEERVGLLEERVAYMEADRADLVEQVTRAVDVELDSAFACFHRAEGMEWRWVRLAGGGRARVLVDVPDTRRSVYVVFVQASCLVSRRG